MKPLLVFISFFVISITITTICITYGMEPWQVVMSNLGVGAALGLVIK